MIDKSILLVGLKLFRARVSQGYILSISLYIGKNLEAGDECKMTQWMPSRIQRGHEGQSTSMLNVFALRIVKIISYMSNLQKEIHKMIIANQLAAPLLSVKSWKGSLTQTSSQTWKKLCSWVIVSTDTCLCTWVLTMHQPKDSRRLTLRYNQPVVQVVRKARAKKTIT